MYYSESCDTFIYKTVYLHTACMFLFFILLIKLLASRLSDCVHQAVLSGSDARINYCF